MLFELGEESQINRFFDEMICRARQRPNKIEVFREYYAAVSWSVCMALNSGHTYKEATDAILNDVIMWTEYMSREPKEDKKRKRPELLDTHSTESWLHRQPQGGKKGKSKGKYKEKGAKGRDYTHGQWQQKQWQRPTWRTTRWRSDESGADE